MAPDLTPEQNAILSALEGLIKRAVLTRAITHEEEFYAIFFGAPMIVEIGRGASAVHIIDMLCKTLQATSACYAEQRMRSILNEPSEGIKS